MSSVEFLRRPLTQIISSLLCIPPGPKDDYAVPVGFDDRPHDHAIINKGWKRLLLKTGRQVEKSFKLLGMAVAKMVAHPGFRAMYVAPTDTDLHTFSDEKLESVFSNSPAIRQYLLTGEGAKKSFSEWRFRNGSTYRLRNAARGGANLRGPTVDLCEYDEYQLIGPGVVSVGSHMLSHSEYGYEFFSGTPLTFDNPIESDWNRSTQTEWYIKCEHCSGGERNYYNIIGLRNFTPKGLICDRCGRFIDPLLGMWVDHVAGASIQGFRIPQGIGVWTKFHKLYWETLKEQSENVIANEVLGLSYDSAEQYLSLTDLKAASRTDIHLVEDVPFPMKQRRTFMGIDWSQNTRAGAFNSAVIGIDIDGVRWRPLWMKIYPKFMSADDQMRDMIQALDRFNVNLVAADHGCHGDRNIRIARHMGDPLKMIQVNYVNSMDYYGKFIEDTRVLRVGRTPCLSTFKSDLTHRGNIQLPNLDDIPEFIPHYTAEKVETTRYGNLNYILPEGRNDDGLMSTIYANICHRVMRGMPAVDDVYMPSREDMENRSSRADAW